MVEREKVADQVRQLRQYLAFLHALVEKNQESVLGDFRCVGSMRYYLQVAIETCINIANHIISAEKLRAPKDYKDAFLVLHEAGILPADLTQTMREVAGLRNLLVHL